MRKKIVLYYMSIEVMPILGVGSQFSMNCKISGG